MKRSLQQGWRHFKDGMEQNGYLLAIGFCLLTVVLTARFTEKKPETQTAEPTPPPFAAQAEGLLSDTQDVKAVQADAQNADKENVNEEKLALPLHGRILQPFSLSLRYDERLREYRAHPEIDLYGQNGAEVLAASDGTVQAVEQDGRGAVCVTLAHKNGLVTVYRPLLAAEGLAIGSAVEKRQCLGTLCCPEGTDGCLHFACLYRGTAVDPLPYLEKHGMNP